MKKKMFINSCVTKRTRKELSTPSSFQGVIVDLIVDLDHCKSGQCQGLLTVKKNTRICLRL